MTTEKSPLLSNGNDYNNLHYGHSSEALDADQQATYVTVPPIGPDELPPPYNSTPQEVPMITCKVCSFMIDITGRRNQYVVKCSSCNEATPIKSAPPGKKYVRCPCNCLLIYEASSQRVTCPRNNCKRIINIAPVHTTNPSSLSATSRISCVYCNLVFLYGTVIHTNALVHCPYCRKSSFVGKRHVKRGIMYMIAAFVMLVISLGITIGTYLEALEHGGFYFVYTGGFALTVWFLYKAIYYIRLKTSYIERPM